VFFTLWKNLLCIVLNHTGRELEEAEEAFSLRSNLCDFILSHFFTDFLRFYGKQKLLPSFIYSNTLQNPHLVSHRLIPHWFSNIMRAKKKRKWSKKRVKWVKKSKNIVRAFFFLNIHRGLAQSVHIRTAAHTHIHSSPSCAHTYPQTFYPFPRIHRIPSGLFFSLNKHPPLPCEMPPSRR
jgi:hypothetical protein